MEQARWITPEINILKAQSHDRSAWNKSSAASIRLRSSWNTLLADPRSYCLVISKTDVRIVPLAAQKSIEALITAYLKAVKAKAPAKMEAQAAGAGADFEGEIGLGKLAGAHQKIDEIEIDEEILAELVLGMQAVALEELAQIRLGCGAGWGAGVSFIQVIVWAALLAA